MASIKYCRSHKSQNVWYIYGFKFSPIEVYRRSIVCYDDTKVWKKTNKMYIVEADEKIKEMLFSSDQKNKNLAVVMLNQCIKNDTTVLINPKIYDR